MNNLDFQHTQDEYVPINCNGLQVQVPKVLRSTINRCRNLHLKIAKTTNHIVFLRRCKRNSIVPKGLTPKFPTVPKKKHLQNKFGITILKQQLGALYRKRIKTLQEERDVREKLQRSLDEVTWTKIWIWILVSEKELFLLVRDRQCKKFDRLFEDKNRSKNKNQRFSNKGVVNISSRELTKYQVSLLKKGLNFVPKCDTRVSPKVIANTELVSRRLGDKGQVLVHITQNYLNNNKHRGVDSLTKQERLALNQLSKEEDLVITNSDKGKIVVVMDKKDYDSRILDILGGGSYRKLTENPLLDKEKKLIKKITDLRDAGFLDNETLNKIRHTNSRIPTIYGCPKIHKEGFPLRPVVSTWGTPWSALAKFLCDIINPLAYPEDTSSVRNSEHFVTLLKEQTIDDQCIILSLDVKNLFGSIPVQKCFSIVQDRLREDLSLMFRTPLPISTIMELITICVETTFFRFGDEFYQQHEGLAMGSPLSPALANLFLDNLERELAQDALFVFVQFLKKFVDDYFLIWRGYKELLMEFFNHINKLEDSINFTMELEKNGELPFLDVKVCKNGNKLITSMYAKEFSSGVVLNYASEHPLNTKLNLVRNMADKITHCSDDQVKDMKILKDRFLQNDYPEATLKDQMVKCLDKERLDKEFGKNNQDNDKQRINKLKLWVPYKGKHAAEFKRKTKPLNIEVRFQRNRNIGEIINKKGKTKGQRETNVIYKLCCECGEFYVGETGRELAVRLGEHERDIKNEKETSGVARHVKETGHKIDFTNVKILDRETNDIKRRIREAYFIRKLNAKLNLYPGYEISDLWERTCQ